MPITIPELFDVIAFVALFASTRFKSFVVITVELMNVVVPASVRFPVTVRFPDIVAAPEMLRLAAFNVVKFAALAVVVPIGPGAAQAEEDNPNPFVEFAHDPGFVVCMYDVLTETPVADTAILLSAFAT